MTDGKMVDKPSDKEFVDILTQAIRKNNIVIFPGDAYYTIGFNYFHQESKEKVYVMKGRPTHKKFPAFISSPEVLAKVGIVPTSLELKAMEKYWPGQLFIAFSDDFMAKVTPTKAIRDAIANVGGIMGATSANRSNYPEVLHGKMLGPEMKDMADAIIIDDRRITEKKATFARLKGSVEILHQGAVVIENI
jgi:L-threonylcarbamoyladenylate synthase